MIYAFGDGFAAGHQWPAWPQLLQFLAPESNVVVSAAPGAGNEFIYDCAFKAALSATADDFFVVQWTLPWRFDKIKQDSKWEEIHNNDEIYSTVRPRKNGLDWYCTSASESAIIAEYKDTYIQSIQSANRTVLFMLSLSETLNNRNIKYLFMNTYSMQILESHANYADLIKLNWADGLNGQHEWSLQNKKIRGTAIQPSSLSHLDYIVNVIAPSLPFAIDNTRQNNIRLILEKKHYG